MLLCKIVKMRRLTQSKSTSFGTSTYFWFVYFRFFSTMWWRLQQAFDSFLHWTCVFSWKANMVDCSRKGLAEISRILATNILLTHHVAFELGYLCLLIRCILRGCDASKLYAVIIIIYPNYQEIHSIFVFSSARFSFEIPDIDFEAASEVF